MQYYLETVPFTCFNKKGFNSIFIKVSQGLLHEEADTVLILHAVDIAKLNPFSECVAYSPDT